jgi:hypothetical protein
VRSPSFGYSFRPTILSSTCCSRWRKW